MRRHHEDVRTARLQVASVDRNVTLFRRLYAQGRHSFTVTANGSIEQTRHPAPP